jgi:hypothetical protein
VAIKVLPDECARDPERRGRFEREARLLAAGAIPRKEALAICRQVAEALEAAHAKGPPTTCTLTTSPAA